MDSYFMTYIKINSRWIKDKQKSKNCKLLEENIWTYLHNLRFNKGFLDMMSKAKTTTITTKIGRLHIIKLKNFCIMGRISKIYNEL